MSATAHTSALAPSTRHCPRQDLMIFTLLDLRSVNIVILYGWLFSIVYSTRQPPDNQLITFVLSNRTRHIDGHGNITTIFYAMFTRKFRQENRHKSKEIK